MKTISHRCFISFVFFAMFFLESNAQVVAPLRVSASTTAIDPYSPDPNAPNTYQGWNYAWGDEFNYAGVPDPAMWSFEKGFTRNQELQWYQEDNASVSDGRLLIEGRRETFPNPNYVPGSSDWRTNRQYVNYTSSSLITCMKRQFYRGRIEVRAKLDTRKGNWPAIWTLGQNKEWPSNGEIDMLEYYLVGGTTPSILANFAWGTSTRWVAAWNSKATPLSYFTGKDADWVNKYHVWRMDWDETTINLYLDDELLNSQIINNAKNADGSICFNQPQYMLLNLALGANGGDPSSTVFPTKYEVDYFRVYQKTVDLEKPTVVTNVSASNISASSCTLTWTPSTDNVGVVAYHLYNNGDNGGSFLGSTSTNSINVTGLLTGSSNSIIVRALDAAGNYSDLSTPLTVTTVPCLSGRVISYGGIYQNNTNNAPGKVFDGNIATFYDANIANGAWVGLDLSNKYQISNIRFCPRSGYYSRMTGGKFQASNSAKFTSGVVDLYTIPAELPAGTWGEAVINNPSYYRYVRYLSPANGFCNVAEIEFYSTPSSQVMKVIRGEEAYQDTETASQETNALKLSMSPNPVSDIVHFQTNCPSGAVELIVTNMAGQVVMKKHVAEICGYKLNLSSLKNGLYLITIKNSSVSFTERLQKK